MTSFFLRDPVMVVNKISINKVFGMSAQMDTFTGGGIKKWKMMTGYVMGFFALKELIKGRSEASKDEIHLMVVK